MFFYMMAYMITNVIEQTFYVFQACRVNHGYSEEICYNISNYQEINSEVQVCNQSSYHCSCFHEIHCMAKYYY